MLKNSRSPEGYEAIIWDCDGVLIDSEALACAIAAEEISAAGYPISTADYVARFMGKGLSDILGDLDPANGSALSRALAAMDTERLRARQREAFSKHLKATAGMAEVLAALSHLPMAVASGSEPARLEHSLAITGLLGFFRGHVYSADMVERGKPAPDIFLYAAERLGVPPELCLVVEDGTHGIEAAQAAGMDVVAYLGGCHMTPALREKVLAKRPQAAFSDMRDILGMAGLRQAT